MTWLARLMTVVILSCVMKSEGLTVAAFLAAETAIVLMIVPITFPP